MGRSKWNWWNLYSKNTKTKQREKKTKKIKHSLFADHDNTSTRNLCDKDEFSFHSISLCSRWPFRFVSFRFFFSCILFMDRNKKCIRSWISLPLSETHTQLKDHRSIAFVYVVVLFSFFCFFDSTKNPLCNRHKLRFIATNTTFLWLVCVENK